MNIAFVTSSRIWGGVKTWMLEFGSALARRGHSVHIWAPDDLYVDQCRQRGLHAHKVRFGSDYHPGTILQFSRRFRELEIDVACMNVQKELRTAGIAARLLGVPVVHRVGLVKDLSGRLDERLTHRWVVSDTLVTSRWMRNGLLSAQPYLRPEAVTVIFNGKKLGRAPEAREKGHPVRFVAAYRLAPDKLHMDLLNALRRVLDAGLGGFTCDIYGEGPTAPVLAATIDYLDLKDRVRLMGFVADVPRVLDRYDFGVLTSRIEGLSNTVLEYLAAGLPTVSTNQGALPELISSGVNGLLYSPGDVDTLAGHLAACMRMPDTEYRRLSHAAQFGVRQSFDQDLLAGQLETYFRYMAGQGAAEKVPVDKVAV